MRWENDRDRDGFITACDGTRSQTSNRAYGRGCRDPALGKGTKGKGS